MEGMKRTALVLLTLLVCGFGMACKKDSAGSSTTNGGTQTGGTGGTTTTVTNPDFIKGADVSWLTQMEAGGYKFYNSSGTQQDCMQILKDKGMNTIRLRAWVNPTDGWCNTADVVAKAVRAKNLGFKIMLDLHYSDVWADPGHQSKPAAWAGLTFTNLVTTVHDYTVTVMNALKAFITVTV
jgi:arabinogalactan endo-1,4-beta-galactosidase